jgi:hypothetical protein
MDYTRANTDWLADCRYGMGVHWTAQSLPLSGAPLPFQRAVEAFNVGAFLDGVVESGADYLIFTVAHALQMIPAPHPVVDAILPGRTCQRDLLAEIAAGLSRHGKHLILYYNHSCNAGDDPAWEQAVGYHAPDKERLAANLCEIVGWMGRRYGADVKAWWFDSAYSLDSCGPNNSVTTDLGKFQFPWERFTAAAKAGYSERLVTYNAGIGQRFLYTDHQDYWAGEMTDLNTPPPSRYLANGLQWSGWTCLDDPRWVHTQLDAEAPDPLYTEDQLVDFLRTCRRHQAPMCFNVIAFQDGTLSAKAVRHLREAGRRLGKGVI